MPPQPALAPSIQHAVRGEGGRMEAVEEDNRATPGIFATDRRANPAIGCKFAPRCPYAIEMCLDEHPPLYQTDGHRVAACYLYREAAVLASEQVDEVSVTVKGINLAGKATLRGR